jgi:nucleotide-binding universal stress UspA family protein
MEVAFGFKAHSGWAALVALGARDGVLEVVERRRLELVAKRDGEWPGQPYHQAEGLTPARAKAVVRSGIDEAYRLAERELRRAVRSAEDSGHRVSVCAVLVGDPMPKWTTEEILSVHFRMHQAEGALYRDALGRAVQRCRLRLVTIREKSLAGRVETALGKRAALLGKSLGPPWGKDQKDAALACMIALGQNLLR